MNEKYHLGLALSGGGARGYSHIGVLRALEEHGLAPQIISGTSMGAIIGSLIANGYTADDILHMAKSKGKTRIFNFTGLKMGLSSHKYVRSILTELLPETFEELERPLFVSATNLSRARHEVFSSGNLVEAILASISIPFIFRPIEINGDYYADGGLMKNLPASSIRDHCTFLVGSHVNHIPKDLPLQKTTQVIDRCVRIAIYNTIHQDKDLCDLYVDPENGGAFGVLDFKVVDDIADSGYRAALIELSKNKKQKSNPKT